MGIDFTAVSWFLANLANWPLAVASAFIFILYCIKLGAYVNESTSHYGSDTVRALKTFSMKPFILIAAVFVIGFAFPTPEQQVRVEEKEVPILSTNPQQYQALYDDCVEKTTTWTISAEGKTGDDIVTQRLAACTQFAKDGMVFANDNQKEQVPDGQKKAS